MPPPRWNDAWTAPVGLVPERPAGEPGPGLLAGIHLAFFLGLGGLGAIATAAAGRSEEASVVTLLVLCVVTGIAGLVLRRQASPLVAWVVDLLLASSAAYLFGAAGSLADLQGASDEASFLTASLVALPWAAGGYALHRRVWTQLATVLALAAALQAALAMRPEIPSAVASSYLLVVGAFLAGLAVLGVARPVRSAHVLAALLATWGAHVLVEDHAVAGALVAVAVLASVAAGVLRTGNRSLLPVVLVAGVVLGPAVLEPLIGTAQAFGLAFALAAAGSAWLAVDLVRRAPRPPQVGGVFAFALALLLVSVVLLFGDGEWSRAVDAVHVAAVAAFFAAAATARRRPATVVSGLLVVTQLPGAFGGGDLGSGLVALAAAGGALAVTFRTGAWTQRPAAAPDQQEVALSGQGREWQVVAPYPQVFDAVVSVLSEAGVPLQLVDRAAGRLVAGDPVQPLLVVAVWAQDLVRSHVRAVGAPHDVDRLESDLAGALARLAPNEVAGPH